MKETNDTEYVIGTKLHSVIEALLNLKEQLEFFTYNHKLEISVDRKTLWALNYEAFHIKRYNSATVQINEGKLTELVGVKINEI